MTFLHATAWLQCSLELPPRLCPWPKDPLLSPPTSVFSAFHDGSYWCSKCPRSGFQSAKGLMRHITHHHPDSVVDEDIRALFVAIERATRSTPSCGGLRRSGA